MADPYLDARNVIGFLRSCIRSGETLDVHDEARIDAALDRLRDAETERLRADATERQRDLAIAHDRQPYPTADAYERACAARDKWKLRADAATARVERLEGALRAGLHQLEIEHGHSSDHPGDWPACRRVHRAIDGARAALQDTPAPEPRTEDDMDRDPGYPFGQRDAMKWADKFERLFPGVMDKGTMLGWFANAIETGASLAAPAPEPAEPIDLRRLVKAIDNVARRHGVAKDPPVSLSVARIFGYTAAPADMDAEINREYARLSQPEPGAAKDGIAACCGHGTSAHGPNGCEARHPCHCAFDRDAARAATQPVTREAGGAG